MAAGHEPPASFTAEVAGDPEVLGLILHGSRATGGGRHDSDFDLIVIVTDEAYARRTEEGRLLERRTEAGEPRLDLLYQSPGRLRKLADEPGWWTATYASARVLLDKTGKVAELVAAIGARADERAREQLPEAYDGYLNSFVRSLKAWRAGDALGGRLHAAESALHLVRALFGAEGRWPPYHDDLAARLPGLEEAQGWPAGYLRDAVLALLEDGDPAFQQELEARVEDLMASRGLAHEWGDDLEPLKTVRFGP